MISVGNAYKLRTSGTCFLFIQKQCRERDNIIFPKIKMKDGCNYESRRTKRKID